MKRKALNTFIKRISSVISGIRLAETARKVKVLRSKTLSAFIRSFTGQNEWYLSVVSGRPYKELESGLPDGL